MIEIAEEEVVKSRIIRIIDRQNGACKRSLTARYDWTDNGWTAKLYRSDRLLDARNNAVALSEIPADIADLAIHALERLRELEVP